MSAEDLCWLLALAFVLAMLELSTVYRGKLQILGPSSFWLTIFRILL